jgi:hypothetical protein
MAGTHIRPIDPDTGRPSLAVHFSAPLFRCVEAHLFDADSRITQLASDVRDQLHVAGLTHQPTLYRVRTRLLKEVDDAGVAYEAELFATVRALITDTDPDDPQLARLVSTGFVSSRLDDVPVTVEIPTAESEAALEESIADAHRRGGARATEFASQPASTSSRTTAETAPAPAGYRPDPAALKRRFG